MKYIFTIAIIVISLNAFAQQKTDSIDPETNSSSYNEENYYFSKNFDSSFRHQYDKWGNAQLENDFLNDGQWRVVNMNDEARIGYSPSFKFPESFLMELRFEQIEGSADNNNGIIIGELGKSQLIFTITANGNYSIRISPPLAFLNGFINVCSGYSDEIMKGKNVMNTLRIMKENRVFSFMINNKKLCSTTEFNINNEPKRFYLQVDHSTLDFDYFRIADKNSVLNSNYLKSFIGLKNVPREWRTKDVNSFDSYITNDGNFRINKKSSGKGDFEGPELDLNNSFDLEFSFKNVNSTNYVGMYLRSKESANDYLSFVIFKDNFSISRKGNRERSISGISQAIKQGNNDNILRVVKSDSDVPDIPIYSFFINGELVHKFDLLSLDSIYNLGVQFSHKGTISLSKVDFKIIN